MQRRSFLHTVCGFVSSIVAWHPRKKPECQPISIKGFDLAIRPGPDWNFTAGNIQNSVEALAKAQSTIPPANLRFLADPQHGRWVQVTIFPVDGPPIRYVFSPDPITTDIAME